MVESVHCAKINSRGNCNNSPHPLQSVQKRSKLNPGFKAMSEWRWEERAPRFAGDHMLTGKLVPMFSPSKAPWMLKAWLWAPLLDHRQRGPPTFSLLQVSASRSAVASSSHGLFSTAAPWPPAPGLRPRTAGVKQRQNPGTLEDTYRLCPQPGKPLFLPLLHDSAVSEPTTQDHYYYCCWQKARRPGAATSPCTHPGKNFLSQTPLLSITLDDNLGW